MLFRPMMRKVALEILGSAPVVAARHAGVRRAKALTVLNLHRVSAQSASAYEALSPALFDQLVGWLKQRYHVTRFSGLDVDDGDPRPPLILSFDDGYKDFVEIVAPILRKHGVTANQNIVPTCIDSGLPPITVLIQDFVGSAPEKLLRETRLTGLDISLDPHDRPSTSLRVSSAFQKMPICGQKQLLSQINLQLQKFDGFRPTPIMNHKDLEQLCSEFEIGAHSFEHATMTQESETYLENDLRLCRGWFQERFGTSPTIYAFPNGMASEEHCEIAKRSGFDTVLLVGERFSSRRNWCHGRFTFHAKTMAEARFRTSGAFSLPN